MYVGISNERACLMRTNELTKDNAMFALDGGGIRPPKSEKVRIRSHEGVGACVRPARRFARSRSECGGIGMASWCGINLCARQQGVTVITRAISSLAWVSEHS